MVQKFYNGFAQVSKDGRWGFINGKGKEITPIQYDALLDFEYGDVEAMRNIGHIYEEGRGIPQDYAKAMEWFSKAAEKGDTIAITRMGILYQYGLGVEQDYMKALDLYRSVGARGYIRQLRPVAIDWYYELAENGNVEAMYNMGLLHFTVPNYSQSMDWYLKAAEEGNAKAMERIGFLYQNGHGVTRNFAKAVDYYKKAVDQGLENKAAVYKMLSVIYSSGGYDVAKEEQQAKEYLQLAEQQ